MLQGSDAANNPELDYTVLIKIVRYVLLNKHPEVITSDIYWSNVAL